MKHVIKLIFVLLIPPLTIFAQSSGTGFLISNNGYIATCYHVIEGATELSVTGINNDFSRKYRARIVATDKANDLAILKIDFNVEMPISYSFKWDVSEVGQEVFTLGYPLKTTMGEEIKLTNGIISSKSGFQGDITTYQITVPVQPGNSGGPLFDKNGFVIGVINAKHTGAENVGYAVKSNILKNLIQSSSQNITLPQSNQLYGKPLTSQVKLAKKDVLIIEVNSSNPIVSENNKPIDVKTRSEAKIKDKPDVFGNIIGYIPKSTVVQLVGKENEYWNVFYNGKLGYSHEMYFEETLETIIINEAENYSKMPPEHQNNNELATISNDAKMKNKPSVFGDIITVITKGEIIYVVGFEDGFWKVFYDGKIGYLMDGMYFKVTYEMMRFKKH
jgi:S1-C subfamily serine protease